VLDPRPELDVVGEPPGGELRFESIAGAARLSNGVLVVGAGQPHVVVYRLRQ
jgi:hypothetical protein